jgi:hypothetical protein
MSAPIRLGTDLIDLTDGRRVVVSEMGPQGPLYVRKRRLGSKRWYKVPFDPERFRRRPRRRYAKAEARHEPEVRRLAKALGLACWEVKLQMQIAD